MSGSDEVCCEQKRDHEGLGTTFRISAFILNAIGSHWRCSVIHFRRCLRGDLQGRILEAGRQLGSGCR